MAKVGVFGIHRPIETAKIVNLTGMGKQFRQGLIRFADVVVRVLQNLVIGSGQSSRPKWLAVHKRDGLGQQMLRACSDRMRIIHGILIIGSAVVIQIHRQARQ